MPRYSSDLSQSEYIDSDVEASLFTNIEPAGFLGIFGSGFYKTFFTSSTFTIPTGVTSIRVRVVGAGGSGRANVGDSGTTGGAGGGYAHGVFSVTPGRTYEVTVGLSNFTPNSYGGLSAFGGIIFATGGYNGGISQPQPGKGYNGDFQAEGGTSNLRCGGGGAGSQLGNGGEARMIYGGGAGVGQGNSLSYGGGSAFGCSYDTAGAPDILGVPGLLRSTTRSPPCVIRFPFDGFIGSGGAMDYIADQNNDRPNPLILSSAANIDGIHGGGGGGGRVGAAGTYVGNGGAGGGGGAGEKYKLVSGLVQGAGGIGGGGGVLNYYSNVSSAWGTNSGNPNNAKGGNGLVVVEW